MWRTWGESAQLLHQAWVQGEGGVDPAEGVYSLCLDTRPGTRSNQDSGSSHIVLPGIKYAVDWIPQVLLGCCQGRETCQQEDSQLGLELTLLEKL